MGTRVSFFFWILAESGYTGRSVTELTAFVSRQPWYAIKKIDVVGTWRLPLFVGGAGSALLENTAFRQATAPERLDLTSYMSYTDNEGRAYG
jgi:hypothetical protein